MNNCKVEGCEGTLEANPSLYLALDPSGQWYIDGVGDEGATVTCSEHGHVNSTPALDDGLTAYLEMVLPYSTWRGSDNRPAENAFTVNLDAETTRLHEHIGVTCGARSVAEAARTALAMVANQGRLPDDLLLNTPITITVHEYDGAEED